MQSGARVRLWRPRGRDDSRHPVLRDLGRAGLDWFVSCCEVGAVRTCTCCGETKSTRQFSWNSKAHVYTETCRECGVWLTMFRQVFGPTRDVERNREMTRLRKLVNKPAVHLQEVWGIRRAA